MKRYVIFSQPAGVQEFFFPTLKTFLSFSFAIQDSFLLNFGFAGYFFLFFDPRPLAFVMVHP